MTGTGVISTPNLYIPWHKFLQSSTWSATEPPSRFRRSKFSGHATGDSGDLPSDWFRSTLAAMYCCCKDSKFTAVTTITTLPGYKNNEQRAEIRLALISSSRPWPTMIFQLNEKKWYVESFNRTLWTSEFKAMFGLLWPDFLASRHSWLHFWRANASLLW